jgi:HprK-related kinase A
VILADFGPEAFALALAGGIRVRTGKVVTCIRSELPRVAAGLFMHYAQHSIEPADSFADFHVRVDRPRSLRRWLRPQVQFYFDEYPPFRPLPLDQAFPMLEWGLNWCVSAHCHQYLAIHAAVVERGGRALVLPAPPGTGKSTLCAGLVSRGWRLLSDELALIDRDGSLVPLARPISLKNASIGVIRGFAQDAAIGPAVRDTVKGTVAHMAPPPESVRRSDESASPAWIVFPRYQVGAAAALTPLPRARAFMALVQNAFNYGLHGRHGFDLLAEFVEHSRCHEFVYQELEEAAAVFQRLADA